ncbi:MAG: hypothetical protein ACXADY_20875 [Candidatus Hodarchaeales archaeon]
MNLIGGDLSLTHNKLYVIKSALNKINIRVNISTDNLLARFFGGDYDIAVLGFSLLPDPHIFFDVISPSSLFNSTEYQNSSINTLIDLGVRTPVKQEREFYYSGVQTLIQDAAPYLYLVTERSFYAATPNVMPFVSVSGAKISFNYSTESLYNNILRFSIKNDNQTELSEYRIMENVKVSSYTIYFPFTDAIIYNLYSQPITVNMTMSHDLGIFLPTQETIGKYYRLSVTNDTSKYRFRCYYDPCEIPGLSPDRLALFQYNEKSNSWEEIETVYSNVFLRYVEVELLGGVKLLKLGESLTQLTYTFFPFVTSITAIMLAVIITTLVKNQKVVISLRKRPDENEF